MYYYKNYFLSFKNKKNYNFFLNKMNFIDSMPSPLNEIHNNGMDKSNLSTMQLEEDNNDFDNL